MKKLFAADHLPLKMEDAIKLLHCVYIALISIRGKSEKMCSEHPFLVWFNICTVALLMCKLSLVGTNIYVS